MSPSAPYPTMVRVVEPTTMAAFGTVAGATLTRDGDGKTATFTLKHSEVGHLVGLLAPGRALAITDDKRVTWLGTAAPARDGDTLILTAERKGA